MINTFIATFILLLLSSCKTAPGTVEILPNAPEDPVLVNANSNKSFAQLEVKISLKDKNLANSTIDNIQITLSEDQESGRTVFIGSPDELFKEMLIPNQSYIITIKGVLSGSSTLYSSSYCRENNIFFLIEGPNVFEIALCSQDETPNNEVSD